MRPDMRTPPAGSETPGEGRSHGSDRWTFGGGSSPFDRGGRAAKPVSVSRWTITGRQTETG